MKFNEAIQELGVSDLWAGFIHEINLPVRVIESKPHLSKQFARIHVETLLGHAGIMLDLNHKLAESYGRELDHYNERLKLRLEVGEMLLSEKAALGKLASHKNLLGQPVEHAALGKTSEAESREMAREQIGALRQMYTQLSSSEDYSAMLTRRQQALKVFGLGVLDAVEAVNRRVHEICLAYGLENEAETLGAQLGPGYFRGKDAKYSGPQNPPLKPSGDTDFIMSASECWCIYCNSKVEKSEKDKMQPCEHLVCLKCLRMLSSKVTIPGDTRTYDYGDLKHHPHAGTKP